MRRRFYVLRIVVFLFKLAAFILLVVGLFSLIFALVRLSSAIGGNGWKAWAHVTLGLIGFAWAVWEFMVLYALGEGLNVLMAVEENTRAGAMRLNRLLALLPPGEGTPSPAGEVGSSQGQ